MGFIDILHKTGLIEVSESETKKENVPVQPQPNFGYHQPQQQYSSPNPVPGNSVYQNTPMITPELNEKYSKHFNQLMNDANLPGPDYYEFMCGLQNMQTMGLPEDKTYQATFGNYTAMGGNPDSKILVNTATQYLGIINENKVKFNAEYETAIKQKVGSVQQTNKDLETTNVELGKQIETLQKQIQENNLKITENNNTIHTQTQKLMDNHTAYHSYHTGLINKIQDHISKINQYIGVSK